MSLQSVITPLGSKEKKIGWRIHDALADEADWNAPFWLFEHSQLGPVITEIKTSFLQSEMGIRFSALWAGDEAEEEVEVSLQGLLERFEQNEIGTRTTYIIRK